MCGANPRQFSVQQSKQAKKTKQIQVKFIKEESIFNLIDSESLELYRQMMADRYGNLHDEEE